MKRKGWHRKKRWREDVREHSRLFEALLVEVVSKAPQGSLDVLGTPKP